jgi:hypothetical protein
MPNHHTRMTHRGRGRRDESNDAAQSLLQSLESAVRTTNRWRDS